MLYAAFRQETDTDIGELLIANGADVNAKNNVGSVALHSAAMRNSIALAKVLIASGADVNAKHVSGETPLHAATKRGTTHTEIVELLKEHGAK